MFVNELIARLYKWGMTLLHDANEMSEVEVVKVLIIIIDFDFTQQAKLPIVCFSFKSINST